MVTAESFKHKIGRMTLYLDDCLFGQQRASSVTDMMDSWPARKKVASRGRLATPQLPGRKFCQFLQPEIDRTPRLSGHLVLHRICGLAPQAEVAW